MSGVHKEPVLPAHVLFGAAYYTEYQPVPRLHEDLDLMRDASLSVIRVGESVWSTWEPRDGVFDLDWLAPVLDGAHDRGIDVVVGTPTYAVPPWLRRRHPEIAAQRRTGEAIPYGHRQDADYSHPTFRWYAERVVRAIVGRYADHPAVIGYQVDNEPGMEILHNPHLFAGFVQRLQARYGDVDALNEAWGLTFWSHRLSDWADLWVPDGNTVQGYDLAWRRYQADVTSEFIHWQAELVRSLARPEQFVMTCLAMGRPAQDLVDLTAGLDVTAVNVYYRMQEYFAVPPPPPSVLPPEPEGFAPPGGGSSVTMQADLAYGLRDERFFVTETNATSIGYSESTLPAYDGQWRQAAWAMVARGARMIEYWHWHTNHYGHETFWGGVLGHSLAPGRPYREIAQLGHEFATAGGALDVLVPDVDVTVLWNHESQWALQFHPPFAAADGVTPQPRAHDVIVQRWCRALFETGQQVAFRTPAQLAASVGEGVARLVRERPVIVVPALYVADDESLELLAAYAEAGGHLVLGFRPGYADPEGRPRVAVQPGPLRKVAGVAYTEFSNLVAPLPVLADGADALEPGSAATLWADGLEPEGAKVLLRYDHPHFGRWAAATTHAAGNGRVTYVGTLPDPALARSLARHLAPASRTSDRWRQDLPPSVTVHGATARAGRLRFVHNWSWQTAHVPLPVAATDLLSGSALDAGEHLTLAPWDVRVLVERDGSGRDIAAHNRRYP